MMDFLHFIFPISYEGKLMACIVLPYKWLADWEFNNAVQ